MKMKVVNYMEIYEVDGVKTEIMKAPSLKVESHWNCTDLVIIETPDGKKYAVRASDLTCAIENARNVPRL